MSTEKDHSPAPAIDPSDAQTQLRAGLTQRQVSTVRQALASGARWDRGGTLVLALVWVTDPQAPDAPEAWQILLEGTQAKDWVSRESEADVILAQLMLSKAYWAIAPMARAGIPLSPRPGHASAALQVLALGDDEALDALLACPEVQWEFEEDGGQPLRTVDHPLFRARTTHAFGRLWPLARHASCATVALHEEEVSPGRFTQELYTLHEWLMHEQNQRQGWDVFALAQAVGEQAGPWTPDHLRAACACPHTPEWLTWLDGQGVDWEAPIRGKSSLETLRQGPRQDLYLHWSGTLAARRSAAQLETIWEDGVLPEDAAPRRKVRL